LTKLPSHPTRCQIHFRGDRTASRSVASLVRLRERSCSSMSFLRNLICRFRIVSSQRSRLLCGSGCSNVNVASLAVLCESQLEPFGQSPPILLASGLDCVERRLPCNLPSCLRPRGLSLGNARASLRALLGKGDGKRKYDASGACSLRISSRLALLPEWRRPRPRCNRFARIYLYEHCPLGEVKHPWSHSSLSQPVRPE